MRVMVVGVVRWCMGGAGGCVGLWEGVVGGVVWCPTVAVGHHAMGMSATRVG